MNNLGFGSLEIGVSSQLRLASLRLYGQMAQYANGSQEEVDVTEPVLFEILAQMFDKFWGAHAPPRVPVGASPTVWASTPPTVW
jgi:hypothetical protein